MEEEALMDANFEINLVHTSTSFPLILHKFLSHLVT